MAKPSAFSSKRVLVLLLFAGVLTAFHLLGGTRLLDLATLQSHRQFLLDVAQDRTWLMVGAAVVVYTASTAFSLPIATLLSLAVGFLFGRWAGTAIIVCSATLGATAVFLVARYVFAEAAQRRMGPAAQKIIAGFQQEGFYYLLFLRLVPLFPFWLVNLAPAFTPIPTRTYVAATALGILPASFIFANLGEALGEIASPKQLLSAKSLTALLLLGLLALLPPIVKGLRARRGRGEGPIEPEKEAY